MPNPLHFGVCVGINRYPEFRDLKFARRDAEAFHDWLISPGGGGLPSGNAKLVVVDDADMPDGTLREDGIPSQSQILDEIKKWIDTVEAHLSLNIGDWEKTRLYVFVSGHGIAPTGNSVALLAADSSPSVPGNHLDSGRLRDFFQETQSFREVVVFADCCRERVSGIDAAFLPWLKSGKNRGEVSYLVGCGAEYGGLAFEPSGDPELNRGHFTGALLQALKGAAIASGETAITGYNLKRFLEKRVKEIALDNGVNQKAYVDGGGGEIVFTNEETAAAEFEITIRFPAGYSGEAFLLDGSFNEVDRKNVTEPSWTVSLKKGLYLVSDENETKFANGGQFMVVGEKKEIHV